MRAVSGVALVANTIKSKWLELTADFGTGLLPFALFSQSSFHGHLCMSIGVPENCIMFLKTCMY